MKNDDCIFVRPGEEPPPKKELPTHLLEVDYAKGYRLVSLKAVDSQKNLGIVVFDTGNIELVEYPGKEKMNCYNFIEQLKSMGKFPLDTMFMEELFHNPAKIRNEWLSKDRKVVQILFLGMPLFYPENPETQYATVVHLSPVGTLEWYIHDMSKIIPKDVVAACYTKSLTGL